MFFDLILHAPIGKFRVVKVNLKKGEPSRVQDYRFPKDAFDNANAKNRARMKDTEDLFFVYNDDGRCLCKNPFDNVKEEYKDIAEKFRRPVYD